ncbi:Hpt domain-containing protein [Christensenella tenuis]|uniref:Hpt domain-containing protein n=1 Tax=Christensenella tenuis TaxID=2763033 RepID=A0ABR7EJ89_9FIRM|nr:Hpt domain-containing protein [Christensenella tenuis]MBC5649446.1 Hpt domain-containing protein [Christensenella tenuis]
MEIETMNRAGIDYQDGLRRMSGNEALYHKFLKKFLQDESLIRLKDCLSEGDMEGVYEAAHTLKGTSGTLGMYELSDCCDEVCKKLRNKEADFDIDSVYNRYDAAVKAIEEME